MKTRILVSTLIAVAFGAMADEAPVRPYQSGTVIPYKQIDISLDDEVIDLYLDRDHYRVEVLYHFTNHGPDQTIAMGFPNIKSWYFGDAIKDFQAWVDGREMDVRTIESAEEVGDRYAGVGYDTFEIHLEEGQTIEVRNLYTQRYEFDYGGVNRRAEYILTTGALWRGPIESIRVNVHYDMRPEECGAYVLRAPRQVVERASCADYYVERGVVLPKAFRIATDDGMAAEFGTIEPRENIVIHVSAPVTGWPVASSTAVLEGSSLSPEHLFDDDPSTCWAEGVDGPGIGETLSHSISSYVTPHDDGDVMISGVGIVNGNQASEEAYEAYGRVKRLRVDWTSSETAAEIQADPLLWDESSVDWEIADTLGVQYHRFPQPVPLNEIMFTIEDVYSGGDHDETCIAELFVVPTSVDEIPDLREQ